MTSKNPPDTTPTLWPRRCRVRINVLAPGVRVISFLTSFRMLMSAPANKATRSFREVLKSISPRIARSVIATTLAPTPNFSAIKSITSSCMRVESISRRTMRLARRVRPLCSTAISMPFACAISASSRWIIFKSPSSRLKETSNSIAVRG